MVSDLQVPVKLTVREGSSWQKSLEGPKKSIKLQKHPKKFEGLFGKNEIGEKVAKKNDLEDFLILRGGTPSFYAKLLFVRHR